jgi:hypothetical protein
MTAGNNAQANGLINPLPFKRTGPGVALDGQPKFDLNQFDPNFFDRLRTGVVEAGRKGIYVQVMLFQGWSVYNDEGTHPWFGHYYNSNNNINGIEGDANGDGDGREIFTLKNPSLTSFQEAYVRKMIDTLNDLDNVIWEIANEVPGDAATSSWQYHMIALVKNYEAAKAKQHPVGMSSGSPDLKTLTSSPADWIAPGATTFNSRAEPYNSNPPATTGNKVFILDSDHLGYSVWNDVNFSLQWIWKSFTRGYNILAQELSNNSAAQVIGYTNVYAKKMNLAGMTPQGSLSSTGYALANPGSEYLVYQPESRGFSVNLASGTYNVEWLNPATGAITADTSASGGGARTFTPPFSGQAVLYLRRQL